MSTEVCTCCCSRCALLWTCNKLTCLKMLKLVWNDPLVGRQIGAGDAAVAMDLSPLLITNPKHHASGGHRLSRNQPINDSEDFSCGTPLQRSFQQMLKLFHQNRWFSVKESNEFPKPVWQPCRVVFILKDVPKCSTKRSKIEGGLSKEVY